MRGLFTATFLVTLLLGPANVLTLVVILGFVPFCLFSLAIDDAERIKNYRP